MNNKNVAILGSFFGDESKGSFTHFFSPNFDYVVRAGGGNNCGHTIYHDGKKQVHHLVPSIDYLHSSTKGILGANMVINLEALLQELKDLEKIIPGVSKRIIVDPDAFVVLPKHIEEDKNKNADLGSTNRGIGPAYTEKISRRGTKVKKFIDDNNEVIIALKMLGVKFNYVLELYDELQKAKILFEGAQSILLDPNLGTYPFTTSGDCGINSIYNAGFAFAMPQIIYGVSKVYATRVGEGPFPTELHGQEAENLRTLGNEYGATTLRPRRVGWLDVPALNYAIAKSGINRLILTKFDILNGLDEITVCDRYQSNPVSAADFTTAVPCFTKVKGWNDAHNASEREAFCDFVQKRTGVPIFYISCGISKKDIIEHF